jgi:hypothetical protein
MPDDTKKTPSVENKPLAGPAAGQKPQTTSNPGQTTVKQTPAEVKEAAKFEGKDPVTTAKSQKDLDKAAVESHNPDEADAPKQTDRVEQKTLDQINEGLDKIVERIVNEDLPGLVGDGDQTDIKSQLVARLRRGLKGVGAAPLRHTSGGSPSNKFDEAREKGLAPVQGSF